MSNWNEAKTVYFWGDKKGNCVDVKKNVQINTDIAKAPLPTTATELLLYIWDGIRCVAHRQVFYSIIIPLCTGKEAIRSLTEGSQSLLLLSDTWKPNAHLSHYLRLQAPDLMFPLRHPAFVV